MQMLKSLVLEEHVEPLNIGASLKPRKEWERCIMSPFWDDSQAEEFGFNAAAVEHLKPYKYSGA